MNITGILPELREVFLNELEVLLTRHSEVAEAKRELIKRAVTLIKRVANSNKKLTLNNVLEVSQLLENQREEVVELYAWYKLNAGDKMTIEEIKDCLEELGTNGFYIRKENLIYLENTSMRKIKEYILEELIEEEYFVDKLFDKEELIEMWLEGTSKEEVIKDMANSAELEEILENEPRLAYSSAELGNIIYVYIE